MQIFAVRHEEGGTYFFPSLEAAKHEIVVTYEMTPFWDGEDGDEAIEAFDADPYEHNTTLLATIYSGEMQPDIRD